MKNTLIALCLAGALACAASAADKTNAAQPRPAGPQDAARKALLEKYDTNKDGKLDRREKESINKEELEKAGLATAEQQTARNALRKKYDANGDGKLDKEERAKLSKTELEKAGWAAQEEKKAN